MFDLKDLFLIFLCGIFRNGGLSKGDIVCSFLYFLNGNIYIDFNDI